MNPKGIPLLQEGEEVNIESANWRLTLRYVVTESLRAAESTGRRSP
jgi:hypothetical protein